MLYIDDQPYFFKGSQHWQQYSFAVSPGIHSIKLRIHNKLVYTNWVMVQKGVKTIVSLNANAVSSVTRFEKMPDSDDEAGTTILEQVPDPGGAEQ